MFTGNLAVRRPSPPQTRMPSIDLHGVAAVQSPEGGAPPPHPRVGVCVTFTGRNEEEDEALKVPLEDGIVV